MFNFLAGEDLLEENPYALLDIPCDLIPEWQNVAGHEIPDAVFDRLDTEALFEDAEIQRPEEAAGAYSTRQKSDDSSSWRVNPKRVGSDGRSSLSPK